MTSKSIMEQYLTKTDAASILGKSVPTLDRWHRLGTGSVRTRIGNTVLYRKDTFENWMLAQQEVS